MVNLLIVAPSSSFTHHVPAGFIFADEVFKEARLRDPISSSQSITAELERSLSRLARRYPRRIRVWEVDLWSPAGLWISLRFRLREFPAVIVNGKEVLSQEQLGEVVFREYIENLLARSGDG